MISHTQIYASESAFGDPKPRYYPSSIWLVSSILLVLFASLFSISTPASPISKFRGYFSDIATLQCGMDTLPVSNISVAISQE